MSPIPASCRRWKWILKPPTERVTTANPAERFRAVELNGRGHRLHVRKMDEIHPPLEPARKPRPSFRRYPALSEELAPESDDRGSVETVDGLARGRRLGMGRGRRDPTDADARTTEQGRVAGLRRAPRRQGRGQPPDGAPQDRKDFLPRLGEEETAGSKTGKLWVKPWFGLHVDIRSRSRSTSASPERRGPKPKRR